MHGMNMVRSTDFASVLEGMKHRSGSVIPQESLCHAARAERPLLRHSSMSGIEYRVTDHLLSCGERLPTP